MKSFLAWLIGFLIGYLLLSGCQMNRPTVVRSDSVRTVISAVVHDSLVVIPADSSAITALFECDSLNQVIMREITVLKGTRLIPEVTFRNQVFRMTTRLDSLGVYLQWKQKHEVTQSSVDRTITKVEQVVYKPPALKFLAWIGGASLLYLLVVTILKIILKLK
jgi:hypothetical protein